MKKKITTINELVEAFKTRGPDDTYLSIMSSIEISHEEYEKFYTWHKDHYTRNSLAKTDDFELLLICFEKGQFSSIHDFDASDAWIHPVMGSMMEERFRIDVKADKLEKVSSVILDSKQYSFVCEHVGIHRYTNYHDGRSASLNLYVKPIEKWNVFSMESSISRQIKVARHAIYF